MRSFLTILLASGMSFMAFAMLSSEAKAGSGLFALEITLQENGKTFDAPKIVVEPGKRYSVALNAGAEYALDIEVSADTRAAAITQFDRDLGEQETDFLLVNTELSFNDRPEAKTLPDYGKVVISNLLLRVAAPQREIRSDVSVLDRGLLTKSGIKIETLSISIRAVPFAG